MNSVLNQLQREVTLALTGLDVTQTQLQPVARTGQWSIQQIIEHLLLTYSGTEIALNARLAKQSPTRARPSTFQRIRQHAVCRFGYFPNGRIAPPLATPPPTAHALSGEELTQATAGHLEDLDTLCEEAGLLFGSNNRCASHMVLGPLSVDQWRRFHLIHGRHHLKQIAAIRKAHKV
jgi:DinB superfamily